MTARETDDFQGHPVVLLTGLSGAGKGVAARIFEDMGWQVVDNLPPRLIQPAVESRPGPLCLVCDVRWGDVEAIERGVLESGALLRTVFLDASDDELVRRFKETRRPHPLYVEAEGILPAIRLERARLGALRASADLCIDTTSLNPGELRRILRERFSPDSAPFAIQVTVASFGFKHGIPLDADLVFDVRFLRNPYYDPGLRFLDGRDSAVDGYVMSDPRSGEVLDRLRDLITWSLPSYVEEGKAYLTIAIGCTGGRHRSVAMACRIADAVSEAGYSVRVEHRDLGRS